MNSRDRAGRAQNRMERFWTAAAGPQGSAQGRSRATRQDAALCASEHTVHDRGILRGHMDTRHLKPDGSPKYTNRLIAETSPYLRQHAHNPVEWYPWGAAALERARRERKPIHLSIGYSACHWCHIMAHESFEDEATARLLNENFINIKVDREERPDLDRIYQVAQQMLT